MELWLLGVILAGYGFWLYSNRALGTVYVLFAPIVWLLLLAVVWLIKVAVLQSPVVGGYTYEAAWTSMNDNFHPESWEVEYRGENWPAYFALVSPWLGWLLVKQFYEPGPDRDWQRTHFTAIGVFVWLGLMFTACDTGPRQRYHSFGELPSIGSKVAPAPVD